MGLLNLFSTSKRNKDLDYQQKLLDRVNTANKKYKTNGNLKELIKVYEDVFYKAKPPCNSSQNMRLADLYIKAGENDKAWGYLNFLYTYQYAPYEKIRMAQAKILKQEKKYKDAIEMYMLGHLLKSKWNNKYQKSLFIKDIQSSANKLKWNTSIVNHLSDLISIHVKNKNYNEGQLSSEYRNYLGTLGG